MGTLEDKFVSTQLFLAYFADKNPISQKVRGIPTHPVCFHDLSLLTMSLP
jgi:hypothetical protein